MTNHELVKETLEELAKSSIKDEEKEIIYLMINDEKYIVAILQIITILCKICPPLLTHLQRQITEFNFIVEKLEND